MRGLIRGILKLSNNWNEIILFASKSKNKMILLPVPYLHSRSELEQSKFRETRRAGSEADQVTFTLDRVAQEQKYVINLDRRALRIALFWAILDRARPRACLLWDNS